MFLAHGLYKFRYTSIVLCQLLFSTLRLIFSQKKKPILN